MQQKENRYASLFQLLKKLVTLYIEDLKLSSAEKISMLSSAMVIFVIVLAFMTLGIIFLAISAANVLDSYISTSWSYFIIGAVFIIAAVLLLVLRKQLVIDPIARFITKLLLDPPAPQAKPDDK